MTENDFLSSSSSDSPPEPAQQEARATSDPARQIETKRQVVTRSLSTGVTIGSAAGLVTGLLLTAALVLPTLDDPSWGHSGGSFGVAVVSAIIVGSAVLVGVALGLLLGTAHGLLRWRRADIRSVFNRRVVFTGAVICVLAGLLIAWLRNSHERLDRFRRGDCRSARELVLAFKELGHSSTRDGGFKATLVTKPTGGKYPRVTTPYVAVRLEGSVNPEYLEALPQFETPIVVTLEGQGNWSEVLRRLAGVESLISLTATGADDALLVRVGRLETLVELSLGGLGISDQGLESLGNLQELRFLMLRVAIGDRGLSHLGRLRRLEELRIYNSHRLSDAGLSHLSQLRNLTYLSFAYGKNQKITNAGLKILAELPTLKGINASGTNMDLDGAREIGRIRPDLKVHVGR